MSKQNFTPDRLRTVSERLGEIRARLRRHCTDSPPFWSSVKTSEQLPTPLLGHVLFLLKNETVLRRWI